MRRLTIPALVVAVGLILLADAIVLNPTLGGVAGAIVAAVIVIAAAAALTGAAWLVLRHARSLLALTDVAPAVAVIGGVAAVLVMGLRPGSAGASDPAVRWIVTALIVPIGATLFGILFVSTLLAVRRSVAIGSREAIVMAAAAAVVLVFALPIGGGAGAWLASAAEWTLAVPIGGIFRGLLIGVGVVIAVTAARTLLGIGPGDE